MSVTQDVEPGARSDEPHLRPWEPRPDFPADLLAAGDRLSYVVVDEIMGDVVTLAVAPWPGSDEHGRVRFPESPACRHLVVHLRELRERLYERWLHRRPRVGDAFATVLGDEVSRELEASADVVLDGHLRLAAALPNDIVDLSAEARNVAKLAFYAAVAGVQRHQTAVDLGQAKADVAPAPRAAPEKAVGRVRTDRWNGPVVHLPAAAAAEPGRPPRWTVPPERWAAESTDLRSVIRANPDDLFYFLLNIGDGDSQLLLLPRTGEGPRRAVVVDAGTTGKLRRLMADLAEPDDQGAAGVLAPAGSEAPTCALLVATHPHDDHIEGLSELVRAYGHTGIGDLWEPGYFAPTRSFAELMAAVEDAGIPHCEPTAGMVRYVDGVKITVLAPAVQLRTAYDTYGVDCNDASIVLKIEFPAMRITTDGVAGHEKRQDVKLPDPWSIILGADAQTRSWSHVTTDFMQMHRGHDGDVYRALRAAAGRDHLAAHILKVSHHASKHGINIELIERVRPKLSLISSVGGGGRYGFPHALATQAIAEALAPSARKQTAQPRDADLGIHYTGGLTDDEQPLGTIALQVPAKAGGRIRDKLRMWRFGDRPKDDVELTAGRLLAPIYT